MRPDAIHPATCPCKHCTGPRAIAPYDQRLVEPEDIAAMAKGLVAGLLFGATIAAFQYGPAFFDWIAS